MFLLQRQNLEWKGTAYVCLSVSLGGQRWAGLGLGLHLHSHQIYSAQASEVQGRPNRVEPGHTTSFSNLGYGGGVSRMVIASHEAAEGTFIFE